MKQPEANLRGRFARLLTACGFSQTEREEFLSRLQERTFARGASFMRTGDVPRKIAFVLSGAFKLVYLLEGRELIKDFAVAGQFLGGYGARLMKVPMQYDIVALGPSVVLEGDYQSLAEQYADDVAFLRLEKRVVDGLFLMKERREADLLLLAPAERYLRFLERFEKHSSMLKDHEIAAYIGVTNVTLSRIKSRLFTNEG